MSRLMKRLVRRNTAPTDGTPPGSPSASASASTSASTSASLSASATGSGSGSGSGSFSGQPNELKERIAREINTFCIQAQWDREDEHYVHLPTIVDSAETSPEAARYAAHVIFRILQSYLSPSSKKTTVTTTSAITTTANQAYNAINLTRILATHPGSTFTAGIDDKFVATVKKLLTDYRSSNVRQVLKEVLTWMEQERATDKNLKGLLQAWTKEKKAANKRMQKFAPSPNYSTHPNKTKENIRPHHREMFPIYSSQTIPPPNELAERICEARSSALILSQVIEQTPASQFPNQALLPEFSARCQAAADSLQSYINAVEPPDEPTMLSLIEITEELADALSRYRRATLVARRINSMHVDGSDEDELEYNDGSKNSSGDSSGHVYGYGPDGSSSCGNSANNGSRGDGGVGSSNASPFQGYHRVSGSSASAYGTSVPTQSTSSGGIATTAPPVPQEYRNRQHHQYSASMPSAQPYSGSPSGEPRVDSLTLPHSNISVNMTMPFSPDSQEAESASSLPRAGNASALAAGSGVKPSTYSTPTPLLEVCTPSSMYVNLHQNTSYGMLPTLPTSSTRETTSAPARATKPVRESALEKSSTASSSRNYSETELEWFDQQYPNQEADRNSHVTPVAASAIAAEHVPPSSSYAANGSRYAEYDIVNSGESINVNVGGVDMSANIATRLLGTQNQRSGMVFGQNTNNDGEGEAEAGAYWYEHEPRYFNPFVNNRKQALATSDHVVCTNADLASSPIHNASAILPSQVTYESQGQDKPAPESGTIATPAASDSAQSSSRHTSLPLAYFRYDTQYAGAYVGWSSQQSQKTYRLPTHGQAHADEDSSRELYDDVEYEERRPPPPQGNRSVSDRVKGTNPFSDESE